MAWTETYALDAAILKKAGAKASAVSVTGPYTLQYAQEVEGFINSATRYDWTAAYGSLNDTIKGFLQDVAACLAAIYVIQYDMSGFTSRIEAEDMINILRDSAMRGLSILRDKKTQDFMIGVTP